jgi:hypothetical protein
MITQHQAHQTEPNAPNPTCVQVRLDPDDYSKLEALAEGVGCHKATILRLLLRQCTKVEVSVEGVV